MSQLVETPLYFHEPTCIWAISCRKCTKEGRNLTLKPGQPGLGYELHPPLTNSMLNKESESEVAQSCLTLCDPVDWGLPGSSVHGIFQARVLEWIAISFSRGSSWPRDRTWFPHIVGRRFTVWATREALWNKCNKQYKSYVSQILEDKFFSFKEIIREDLKM